MLEPDKNPNPRLMVDPPGWLRHLMRRQFDKVTDLRQINKRRVKAEKKRQRGGDPHIVEYFHQLDDPYSHLTAQVLATFAERYNVVIKPHLIRASGGKNQPEAEKLAQWARRDAELIAPHYGLEFPKDAPICPDPEDQSVTAQALSELADDKFVAALADASAQLWEGAAGSRSTDGSSIAALDKGSARLAELGHYSGATFYYAGEWYWGVDRLFHLEQRLRDLGACKAPELPFICPRPEIDVSGVDASGLTLDFYPSLNSPYTSIIYDRTIAMKNECGIRFHHKPVLPMIMRGVPATRAKGMYIMFDTWREGQFLGVNFGPVMTPIGEPTRQAYSLLPWAMGQGKDETLMSSLLDHAFRKGVALHSKKGMRRAVEAAGLDWNEASRHLGGEGWKAMVEQNQHEMIEGMGLWGVPSYRLSGPDGEPDLAVWGQDRLWLIAAEIRKRADKG
ncbi:DsbA family protein [Sphingorhabdus sp. Alg239-R122]|uniref:DsbA family protein n=1 Tax=Sphingorhabdus sp. Alg239-R122 TaxID=2305989 RepID=UPI0013DAE239|nr:DsbA family protein [Sphingorhabdus sp. Alg239-R122]